MFASGLFLPFQMRKIPGHVCSVDLMRRPEIRLVLVDSSDVRKAERLMVSCEHCYPAEAAVGFDWLLARVTRKHGLHDFLMAEIAHCPICNWPVTETTLVEPKD